MPDPIAKIHDIAYVRLRAPDLDAMETFLSDFGLSAGERSKDALCAGGTRGGHFLHVTERGEPGRS